MKMFTRRGKARRFLIIIGIVWSWMFLLQGIDLGEAANPDYPTKPITFIIAYGAGGTTDTAARALTEAASKYLGQSIIPVNKPGGASTIGAMAVMNAKPDGYTLGTANASSVLIMPHTEESPYKDLSGFELILNYGKFIFPLMVRSDAPWKTWKEFIEWARQNPRAAKIGMTSARSMNPQGIAMWKAEQKEKVEFTYLAFKGSGETLTAILGGHVSLYACSLDSSGVSYLREGKLRILAYLGADKIPGHENFPSFPELYGVAPPSFFGVWGPKGIPEYVLEKLDDAFAKAVKDPSFVDVMNRMYTPVHYMNRAEVNRYVREEYPKVGEIVKILRAEGAKEKN
jgi:tripartite-type tricarboxylate transporter receptor subunit TctC